MQTILLGHIHHNMVVIQDMFVYCIFVHITLCIHTLYYIIHTHDIAYILYILYIHNSVATNYSANCINCGSSSMHNYLYSSRELCIHELYFYSCSSLCTRVSFYSFIWPVVFLFWRPQEALSKVSSHLLSILDHPNVWNWEHLLLKYVNQMFDWYRWRLICSITAACIGEKFCIICTVFFLETYIFTTH